MKILFHHRTQLGDAQGVHIAEMVRAFRGLGHEVQIVALVKEAKGEGPSVGVGWWSWMTRWAPAWFYEMLALGYNVVGYWYLRRTILEEKPDVLYERYSLNTFCGVWAAKRFGLPHVLEVNAPLYQEQDALGRLAFKRFARFSERWICSNSTWTVVVSGVLKQILRGEGVPEQNMVVIPNGIDPERFRPSISGVRIHHKYRLQGHIVIGFVGWFRPWHGLEMLLEVFREGRLAERGGKLLLVGDGPAFPNLFQYAKTHDLLRDVFFSGPIGHTEVASYVAAMDIAVQPSATSYASPMKILEYMGMAKSILAPDQPNIREVLQDGVNGILFQPEDKNSLQARLIELLKDSELREKVAHGAGEAIFTQGYLWRANAEKALNLVRSKNTLAGASPLNNQGVLTSTL